MRGVLALAALVVVVLADVVEAADDALAAETESVLLALADQSAGPDYGDWRWRPDGQYRNPTLHETGPLPRFEMELAVWRPALSGELGAGGGPFHLIADLRLQSRAYTGAFGVTGELRRFGLRFDGFLFSSQGDTTLRWAVTVGDLVFGASERVHSQVDIKNFRLLGTYSILGEGVFTLHGLLGASYYDLDLVVSGDGGRTAHLTARAVVPILGLALAYRLGRFRWEGEAAGIYGNLGDYDGLLLDFTVSVSYTFDERVVLRAGYRRSFVDGRFGRLVVTDLTLEGSFLELGIRF